MNLKKVKKQLNKIKQLVDVLEGEDKLHSIERDLLLEYVRTLYSSIKIDDAQVDAPAPKKVKKTAPIREKVIPAQRDNTAVAAAKDPAVVSEPVTVIEPTPPPVPESKVSPEIMSLFTEEESSDLSNKLSSLRITDLTKAFSINERIFTINELFGGDQKSFEATLAHVNGLDNFDLAIKYLSEGVATDNDWTIKDRQKKAKKFIQLVRHKFA